METAAREAEDATRVVTEKIIQPMSGDRWVATPRAVAESRGAPQREGEEGEEARYSAAATGRPQAKRESTAAASCC